MGILAPSWQLKSKSKPKTRPELSQPRLVVDQPLGHKVAEETENPPYLLSILNAHGLAIFLLVRPSLSDSSFFFASDMCFPELGQPPHGCCQLFYEDDVRIRLDCTHRALNIYAGYFIRSMDIRTVG